MMVGTIAEYASCSCGEYHRGALRMTPAGVRCFNCGDTRHRRGHCEVCGRVAPIEHHHVAGRRHAPDIIAVCLNCHGILSHWQRHWSPNWQHGPQSDLFLVQGWSDVLHLTEEHSGIPDGELVDPPARFQLGLCIFLVLVMLVGVVLMLTAPHSHQDNDIVEPWRYL
jgi:hypothetical protein